MMADDPEHIRLLNSGHYFRAATLGRVDGSSEPPDVDEPEDQADHAEEDVAQLLVSRGEAAELLRLPEAALDPVPLLVRLGHLVVPGPRLLAVLLVRDHRQGIQVVQDGAADLV